MEENLTQKEMSSSVNEGSDIMLRNWTNITFESVIVSEDVDPHEETVRMIQVFARPPIIAIGTIGNVLAFVTMQRGALKHMSTCFYMAMLGLADTGVLWTGGFSVWLQYLTRWRVNPYTWTDCKVVFLLFFFSSQYSSSLLMAMTVEKCFSLYFPLQSKSVCTVRTAKKLSVTAAVVLFGFNLHLIFIRDAATAPNGKKQCIWVRVPLGYKATYYQIDAFLYSFIPLSVMFTANCLIILKFMLAKWRNRRGGTESVNQALSKSAIKGTVMLLTVSFAFVILTGPICIRNLIRDPPQIVYGVTVILQYLNHSINGVLYCITGSRFRHELMDLFNCCGTKKPVISNMVNTNTSYLNAETQNQPI